MLVDLEWLRHESENHASVDTFAKKLYLKGQMDLLNKLKVSLSIYFICEQLMNKVDPRYDYFFAALLKNNVREFPEQIRILSWNYDYRFELSYSEYSGLNSLEENQEALSVYNKYEKKRFSVDRFSIAKLNGTTQLTSSGGHKTHNYFLSFKDGFSSQNFARLLRSYGVYLYSSE